MKRGYLQAHKSGCPRFDNNRRSGNARYCFFSLGYLAAKYAKRPFSLEERVLTQFRVLWDYVSQWFSPQMGRMGLYHDDFVWSQSITQPFSTLISILGWLMVLVVSVALIRFREGRLIVFAMLWFLVGHSIESTLWPLELYFEHRNYFPAMGLTLLVGALYGNLVRRWPETKNPLLVWLCLIPIILAFMTSSQAQIWSSRPMLILHHLNGHPQSSRANLDMAVQVAQLGSVEKAKDYSKRAFEVSAGEREGDWILRDLALSCMTGAEISPAEISRIGKIDSRRPLSSVTTSLTLIRILQDNQCPQMDREYFADHLAGLFLGDKPPASASPNIYSNLAVLENALERYDPCLCLYGEAVEEKATAEASLADAAAFFLSSGEKRSRG